MVDLDDVFRPLRRRIDELERQADIYRDRIESLGDAQAELLNALDGYRPEVRNMTLKQVLDMLHKETRSTDDG